jgi:predicted Ser/Thr protein kinase
MTTLKVLSRNVLWDGEIQQVSEQTMRKVARRAKQTGETTEQYLERLIIEYTDGKKEEVREANLKGIEIMRKNTLDYYINPNGGPLPAVRKLRVNYT